MSEESVNGPLTVHTKNLLDFINKPRMYFVFSIILIGWVRRLTFAGRSTRAAEIQSDDMAMILHARRHTRIHLHTVALHSLHFTL